MYSLDTSQLRNVTNPKIQNPKGFMYSRDVKFDEEKEEYDWNNFKDLTSPGSKLK